MPTQEQIESLLGPEQVVVSDPSSGDVIAVGRPINERMPEADFEALRQKGNVHFVGSQWFVVTKWTTMVDLVMVHGKPMRVGLGPVNGFKWIQFADQTICCHESLAKEGKNIASSGDVQVVKCDKEGNEVPRVPRVARGKAYPVSRQAFHMNPSRRRFS